MFMMLLIAMGCTTDKVADCPPNSGGDDVCDCNSGYYGALEWDAESDAYLGECLSGLEMAIQTGDADYIERDDEIIDVAQQELDAIIDEQSDVLRQIYGDNGVYYTPSEWSNHIVSTALENNFILVQGSDVGYSLAVAGQQGDSRYAAFGFNVVLSMDNGAQGPFEPSFDRLLSWMLTGEVSEESISDKKIAISSVGWDQSQTMRFMEQRFDSVEDCDVSREYVDCYSNADMVVVGAQAASEDSQEIAAAVRVAMDSGTAVLFVHTETWTESEQGSLTLKELGMTYGEYGGNYWSGDKAEWESVEDMLALGGVAGSIVTLLEHFSLEDYDFDWSACSDWVGQTFCDEVPGLYSEFFLGAQTIQHQMNTLDSNGQSLFQMEGNRIWKMMALLGDVYRRDIVYSMSKTDADIMPFMRAYLADHTVHYNREFNPSQSDLGSFSDVISIQDSMLESLLAEVVASKYGGYTAIGHYALPGQTFTVERLDGSDVETHLIINTQRIGSTREFNDGSYDRPKFLSSPLIRLEPGVPQTISTPYGGTLQVHVSSSDSDPIIELKLDNVGTHPVLDYGEEPTAYVASLQYSVYPFTELRNPYVQIHSKVDMMLESLAEYDGNVDAFFADLDHYMIQDTYNLAGFYGEELSLNAAVQAFCTEKEWDCDSPEIHGRPALQHINVDTYAHCGGGCSGNPYDQAWALGPLGWGETHEIGHNLQRSRLKIHEGRSNEVSNQIFPLHKHWVYQLDSGLSLSADRVDYRGTFEILQQSMLEPNPQEYVYQNIWAAEGVYDNNSERMAFFVQLVHCNDDLEQFESGWDLYTALYLHERIFTNALNDWSTLGNNLGFDQYTVAPSDISGNDFMLIATSFVTGRDHRGFFEMWGIDFSESAANQVLSFGFPEAERQFVPHDNVNLTPTRDPIAIDGVSVWVD